MDRIRKALLGGHPLLYVLTWEEARVERLAQHLAKTFYGAPSPYGVWSVVEGLVVDGNPLPGTQDPLKALEAILAASGKGFYLMKDFPTAGDGRPEDHPPHARPLPRPEGTRPARPLRLAATRDSGGRQEGDLRRRVRAARTTREISKILEAHLRRRLGIEIEEAAMRRLALAMRGLTADEIGHLVSKVFARARRLRRARVSRGPRREGADVPQGGRARVRAAPLLARGHRRLRGPEDLAAEAAGALLEGRPGRRNPDPQGHPADGDLGLREEPLRQDDLDALEPAALPARHERGLRDGQRRDDVPPGAARRRGRLAGRALDRRDRDGRRRDTGRARTPRCRASSRGF